MKRFSVILLLFASIFMVSNISFAEVTVNDYEIKEIDMKGMDFKGVTGGLIVYSVTTESTKDMFSSYIVRYGLRNIAGDIDTGAVFDKVDPFSEGLSAVYQYDDWGSLKVGYIDQNGKIVIKPKFDSADKYIRKEYYKELNDQSPCFVNGRALVKYNGKFCYIDKKGNVVITTKYSNAYAFSDGLARVETTTNEKYSMSTLTGYINTAGKIIIKPQYTIGYDFKSGLALVSNVKYGNKENTINIINKTGKVIKKLGLQQYVFLAPTFEDGLLLVRREDGKYGYMNTKGNMAIDYKFIDANGFKNGLAKVSMMKDGQQSFGFINTKGEVAINPFEFKDDSYYTFNDGYLAIQNYENNSIRYGLLDRNGIVVLESVFASEPQAIDGGYIVSYNLGDLFSPDIRFGFVKSN